MFWIERLNPIFGNKTKKKGRKETNKTHISASETYILVGRDRQYINK